MVLSSDDPVAHRKKCTVCQTPRDVLIRCQIDDSTTWHMICPGKCWQDVSGGIEDGDGSNPHYRYGGMWKNRHADVTAKKPKKVKERQKAKAKQTPVEWSEVHGKYTKNDAVVFKGQLWVCRKTHEACEDDAPDKAIALWKDDDKSATASDTG
ncbi:Mediator of RNA polymerase II transcription subunit 14 [Sphaceloma murrayae]|uniref:Mediator of RNA polymerase II transcription subunit 14 n=1 Tax=Sphaceloma murrayae TaxID=2082308 RepID=A0A2K1R2F3_9PEZI|nr:Mediator of RNA polymerase II transcription subunit 14 [Sphaceloma murrayae]